MSLMARLHIYRAKIDTERPPEGIGCSVVALAANPWLIHRLAYAQKISGCTYAAIRKKATSTLDGAVDEKRN
jgi:hypothetical protein